jgi:hypothetical protein
MWEDCKICVEESWGKEMDEKEFDRIRVGKGEI